MTHQFSEYEIDDNREWLDFGRVHEWLADSYWSPGIDRDKVERAAAHSVVVIGCYLGCVQVGYARIVSDTVRFAYMADVFVDEKHRGKGIAGAIVRNAQEHPAIADVMSIVLATRDAHEVYNRVGFTELPNTERWMRWHRTESQTVECCTVSTL